MKPPFKSANDLDVRRLSLRTHQLEKAVANAAPGGATDLGYTASTRLLTSSSGADVTLPLATSTDAGLAPASGGGTTNFLRADLTWATPAYPTPLTHQQIQSRISIRF